MAESRQSEIDPDAVIRDVLKELARVRPGDADFSAGDWGSLKPLSVNELKSIADGSQALPAAGNSPGFVIKVAPRDPTHCEFAMDFYGPEADFSIYFGHGLRCEDLSVAEYSPKEVASAILDGRVKETVWKKWGRVLQSKGGISLSQDRGLYDQALGILGVFGSPEEVCYSPYALH